MIEWMGDGCGFFLLAAEVLRVRGEVLPELPRANSKNLSVINLEKDTRPSINYLAFEQATQCHW